jgi:DNA-directed RNA polymerase specialized sigma24 family protein
VAEELSQAGIRTALGGDAGSLRMLVDFLMPVVQSRAARALSRYRPRGRDSRQDVEDLVQEIYVALFENDGRVLKSWDPERGLSLRNFVGLVSQRTAHGILRSGRRTPWPDDPTDPTDMENLDETSRDPLPHIHSRAELSRLMDRLTEELSPRGLTLFYRLCVNQEDVRAVAQSTGMTEQAVYAFRKRLERTARDIAQELAEPDEPRREEAR